MPDLTTHATMTNAVLAASFFSGIYPTETITPTAALAFVVGSLIPDVGNLGYVALGKIRGRGLEIMPTRWRGRVFQWVDNRSWWGWPYKLTHSVLGLVATATLVWFLFGTPVMCGYAFGYMVHLALDLLTHDYSWLWWPARSFRVPVPNWWKLAIHRDHSHLLHGIGVPANTIAAWLMVYGMPL